MNWYKRIGRGICRATEAYVNGCRGVISLFLALVMLPFLTIAVLLVQSARYQHAVQLIDELIDSAGLSTLSAYDEYLHDRFGLLSMSQTVNVQQTCDFYLNANVNALNNSFSYQNSLVDGIYPLSEDDILKTQILEYSEVTVALEAVYEGLNVEDILKELSKRVGLDNINKFANATSDIAKTGQKAVDLLNNVKDLISTIASYEETQNLYELAAQTMYDEAKIYVEALKSAETELEEESNDSIYDQPDIRTMEEKLVRARDDYVEKTQALIDNTEKIKTGITKLYTGLDAVLEASHKAQESIKKVEGESIQDKCTTTSAELVDTVAQEIANVLSRISSRDTYIQRLDADIDRLIEHRRLISGITPGKQTENPEQNAEITYVNRDADLGKFQIQFQALTTEDFPSELGKSLQDAINRMDSSAVEGTVAVGEDGSMDLVALLDIAGDLLGINILANGALDAHVAESALYSADQAGMSTSSQKIINAMSSLIESGKETLEAVKNASIIKLLSAGVKLLEAFGNFMLAVVAWAGEALIGLVTLLASGPEMYDSFLLAAYAVYNLPCRTTYETGKSLTGYSYREIFDRHGGTMNDRVSGILKDLAVFLEKDESGTDRGFRGAALEYLLVGSLNELANQGAAFFDLYMLRLIINLPAILTNESVTSTAAALNMAGWVVYLIVVLLEPMIDSLLLINGQPIYMIKNDLYLSPKGIMALIQLLPKLTNLSDGVKSSIQDSIVAANGKPTMNGWFEVCYQEHMLFLLMLATDQTVYLKRMKNIIQMEAASYYEEAADEAFRLEGANTYLRATVEGKLNAMFDVESLTEGGPWSIRRTRLIGY